MRTLLIYFWPSFNLETHMPLTSISPNCYFPAAKEGERGGGGEGGESNGMSKAWEWEARSEHMSWHMVCLRILSSPPALFPQACLPVTGQNELCTTLPGLWNRPRNVSRCEVCHIWVETLRANAVSSLSSAVMRRKFQMVATPSVWVPKWG